MLFQYNEGRKIIKIGNDLHLLQRVKERFDLDGEIVLQKYNDSWGEWVDVSCPEICHMDKIKVVRLAEPHNQVCLLSFVVPCDFFSPELVLNLPFRELIRSYLNYLGARCYSLEAMLLLTSLRF